MPGEKTCGKLQGKAKRDCLAYKGKYARKAKPPVKKTGY